MIFALLTLGNVEHNRAGKLALILRIHDRINTDQPLAVDAGFNRSLGGKLNIGDGFTCLKDLVEQGAKIAALRGSTSWILQFRCASTASPSRRER